ncbi:excalibur calcium-binding domain-containing protein [Roseococcus sp.]|uniref:excalibur calcium-binding domain-containing protein n=1 Tax=Roseococcus sp. TaxID=2109646 RepID=UPI003BA92778
MPSAAAARSTVARCEAVKRHGPHEQCGQSRLDADRDGIPCELDVWGGRSNGGRFRKERSGRRVTRTIGVILA